MLEIGNLVVRSSSPRQPTAFLDSYHRRLLGLKFTASTPNSASPLLLTFQHRAGVSPYTSSYDFARTCVFDKQSFPPGLCAPHRHNTAQVHDSSGPPYPKVTGAFCRVPSLRFTRTPQYTLPIHQCRFRVRADTPPRSRSFSRQYRITHSPTHAGSPSCLNLHAQRIYLPDSPHT